MEPLPIHLHDKITTNGRSKPHIIYRRSATVENTQKPHMTREIHTCGTEGKEFFLALTILRIKISGNNAE